MNTRNIEVRGLGIVSVAPLMGCVWEVVGTTPAAIAAQADEFQRSPAQARRAERIRARFERAARTALGRTVTLFWGYGEHEPDNGLRTLPPHVARPWFCSRNIISKKSAMSIAGQLPERNGEVAFECHLKMVVQGCWLELFLNGEKSERALFEGPQGLHWEGRVKGVLDWDGDEEGDPVTMTIFEALESGEKGWARYEDLLFARRGEGRARRRRKHLVERAQEYVCPSPTEDDED